MRFMILFISLLPALAPARAEFIINSSVSTDSDHPSNPPPDAKPRRAAKPRLHKPEPILAGFGAQVPLSFAVRQIVPAGIQVIFGGTVDEDALVDWKGGRPWRATLSDALRPLGLIVLAKAGTVTIQGGPTPR